MALLISRGYSQRLSCRVVGLSRSAYNRAKALSRTGNARGDDEEFYRWLLSFANEHSRWGYRRVFIHARREGFNVGRDAFWADVATIGCACVAAQIPQEITPAHASASR